MPFLQKKPQTYNLNDHILFGKHKGETLQGIIEEDPQYVDWLIDNLAFFDISCDALDYLKQQDVDQLELALDKAIDLW